MTIEYGSIILRDFCEADITDYIRWMTEETAWQDWDAPWEKGLPFDAEQYRKMKLDALRQTAADANLRRSFEIDTRDHVHIGRVNAYLTDQDYVWKHSTDGGFRYTLGIDLCESSYWHRGLGTEAFMAYITYHRQHGIPEVFTQTWSGNLRMVRVAHKCGFSLVDRKPDTVSVCGKLYDSLTFALS